MKYYSENLKKLFDTEKDLKEAEAKYEVALKCKVDLKNEKKKRAEEVENAYKKTLEIKKEYAKKLDEAEAEFIKLKNNFVKDYGSFHMTYSSSDDILPEYFSFFRNLFW